MKILKVTICNLNSLAGHHTIDYRNEPLASAGLYAIVGPTGAGKSTVLDAITLALYGRTERDTYGSEVMSHGTGECFAEVEFETGQGTFLSRWERRRARQRPDGNLQTAQLQLSRYDAEAEAYLPMPADRLNEVKELTRETIGLDYDQFVRSVMLTQGQFARFLSSTTKERADILEKITGTGIYSLISQSAFERHKLARENYEKLQESQRHTSPLSEDEREALAARWEKIKQDIAALRPREREVRRQLQLHQTLAAAEERHRGAEQGLRAAETEWAGVKPKREALASSRSLAPLRDPLKLQEVLTGEWKAETDRLARQTTGLKEAETYWRQALEKAAAAVAVLTEFERGVPARRSSLEQATAIENQLAVLKRETENEAPELAEEQRKLDGLAREVSTMEASRQSLLDRLEGRKPDEIARDAAQLEARLEALSDHRSRLSEWQRWLANEVRLEQARTASRQAGVQVRESREVQQVALEKVNRLSERAAGRSRIYQRLKKSKGLEPLRHELAEGEPCPLCGATHHPALEQEHGHLDEDLRLAEKDLLAAERERDDAEMEAQQATKEFTQAETRLEDYREREQALSQEMNVPPPAGDRPETSGADLADRLLALKHKEDATRERQRRLRDLRSAADELNRLDPQLQAAKVSLAERTEKVAVLKTRAAHRREALETLGKEHVALLGGRSVEAARREQETTEANLRRAVAAGEKEVEQTAASHRTAEELLANTRRKASELSTRLAQIGTEVHEQLQRLGVPSAEAARALLLSPEKEEAYRAESDRVELQLHARREALKAASDERQAARRHVAELADLAALDEELTGIMNQTDTRLREQGSVAKEIEQDEQRRFAYGVLMAELEKAEKERHRWARLNDLIGQKDGVKFSRFAQTLTLQRLVEVGNRHLGRINDRYRMQHRMAEDISRENLELVIIDTFQNDNCRPMTTLSGGETFLVSLALALGLSDLASGRTNIQSLFIDEGFGTLDEKILDDAVSALEQLQGQGKTIGLISHVKELRERIHCQIRLEPRGSGRSQLVVTP